MLELPSEEAPSYAQTSILRRDTLILMTRRYALLLSLSAPIVAQVRATRAHKQSKSRPTAALAQDSPVQSNPHPVFVGAPVLFKSKTFSGPATWLGKRIEFRPDGDVFSALAGVSLNQAPGSYPLIFGDERVEVTVTDHAYPSSKITVPEKFAAPPKEIQAQIDDEIAIKQKIFKSSPPERLWQGPFVSPANTR